MDVWIGAAARRVFGCGMLFLPESPALAGLGVRPPRRCSPVLARIRNTSDVEIELQEIKHGLDEAQEQGTWRDLLSPGLRPALIVGIGLAVFQQVTGINTVIYYAPMIIQSAGIPSASGAILTTAGIGVVNVAMTIVSMWLIDRVGRRPLLLTGIAGMIVSLGILGWAFHFANPGGVLSWLCCYQHDGLCGILRHKFGTHFLAFDL